VNTKDDGGMAFPQSYRIPGSSTVTGESGLSMRDYFAAAAMQGILASDSPGDNTSFKLVASMSYQQADAMLESRKQ
jgi:hypothetical protein